MNISEKKIYSKWRSLVNMSKSELESFYNSLEGQKAGLSTEKANELGISRGRESAKWIMRMKETPVKEWTPEMWKWAKKQISFISRMKGNKGALYDEKGNKTRKHTALLIWGHNPLKSKNMRLIKGSAKAKSFMKKLRASKGKKKLSGEKHTDIKSHNYKITIGASGDYAKFEIATIKALAKSLKKPIKTVQKAVYDDKNLLDLISNSFDTGKTVSQTAKLLKAHLVPKKEVKPLDAFVNLLTKKGKGQGSGGTSKANFPMKLPATVTIGSLKSDALNQIDHLNKKIEHAEAFIKHNLEQLHTRYRMIGPAERKHIKKSIALSRKYIASYKAQIRTLKKMI